MRKTLITAALLASLTAGCATNQADREAHEAEIAELRDQVAALHAQLEHANAEVHEAHAFAERQHEEARRMREAHPEIREARRQLKVMRYAVEAWIDADRHDLAESMEYAMHALELRIEGERGEEAQAVFEKEPDREQKAELLAGASRHCREKGQIERAEALAELADVMMRRRRGGEERESAQNDEHMHRIANLAEEAMHTAKKTAERIREVEERMEGIEEVLLELRNR